MSKVSNKVYTEDPLLIFVGRNDEILGYKLGVKGGWRQTFSMEGKKF